MFGCRRHDGFSFLGVLAGAQGVVHDLLRFTHNGLQMRLVAETFRVNLVNVFRAGRTRCKPAARRRHFQSADGALLPGACVSLAMIGSPASFVLFTASGESFRSFAFCSGVAAASMRV